MTSVGLSLFKYCSVYFFGFDICVSIILPIISPNIIGILLGWIGLGLVSYLL